MVGAETWLLGFICFGCTGKFLVFRFQQKALEPAQGAQAWAERARAARYGATHINMHHIKGLWMGSWDGTFMPTGNISDIQQALRNIQTNTHG